MHGLGNVYKTEGDLKAARCHYEESLQIERTIHGDRPHHDIAASLHGLGNVCIAEGDLKVGEISVRKFYINMGMKDQNPMKDVRYYDKKELNQCFTRENYEISLMMPEKYESHVLRMFVKDDKKFQ